VSVPTRSGRSSPSRNEDLGLLGIGSADASQLRFAAIDERQDDVAALDAGKRVEDSASGHVEALCLGKPVQGPVHRVGEEADEDVCVHAMLGLVVNGADGEVLLEGSESGLRVVELHVHLPQLWLFVPGEVGAEEIGALGVSHVLGLGFVLCPGEAQGVAVALDEELSREAMESADNACGPFPASIHPLNNLGGQPPVATYGAGLLAHEITPTLQWMVGQTLYVQALATFLVPGPARRQVLPEPTRTWKTLQLSFYWFL
jgi:hypothetical protein